MLPRMKRCLSLCEFFHVRVIHLSICVRVTQKENPDPFMAPGNEWAKASGGGEGGCGCTIA
jgi:hypothetical protein